MMPGSADQGSARGLFAQARRELAGRPQQRLGERRRSRGLFGFGAAPKIVPVGQAWRLGVFLLTADAVFAVGEVVRSRREVIRGYTAQASRERAAVAAAAFRGGFAEGETLHLGWSELDLAAVDAGGESGPLSRRDDIVWVRWSAQGAGRGLGAYLAEQLSLL
ncbi:glutaminase [Microbacterium sp.]|uniref:glutaminase n=1 Tax=Microbacterium sp. TaxID=51671 RepID=UPI003A8B297E